MKPTPDGKTFEFLHKSFAEYLVARRFVDDVFRFDGKTKPTELPSRRPNLQTVLPNLQNVLREWLQIWGAQRIDADLLRFIKDEAVLAAKEIAPCRDGMAVLLREAIASGLPAHEIKEVRRANRTAETFAAMTDWARNAEEALLVGLHGTVLAARAADPAIKHEPVPLVDPEAGSTDSGERHFLTFVAGNLLARLQRQLRQGFIAHKCLSSLDLSGANLSAGNLMGANLSLANLSGADLFKANLFAANLSKANLNKADLRVADLSKANFTGADLFEADLFEANLSKADLSKANLRKAELGMSDLSNADLRGADLRGADVFEANFRGADLTGAELFEARALDHAKHLDKARLPKGWSAVWNKEREAWDIKKLNGAYIDPRNRSAKS